MKKINLSIKNSKLFYVSILTYSYTNMICSCSHLDSKTKK